MSYTFNPFTGKFDYYQQGVPVIPTGRLTFGNGTATLQTDANLTWDATNGLTVLKNVSCPANTRGERFGASAGLGTATSDGTAVGNGALAQGSSDTVVGAGSTTGVFGSQNTLIGKGLSTGRSNVTLVGFSNTAAGDFETAVGASNNVSAGGVGATGAFGFQLIQSNVGGMLIGSNSGSYGDYELAAGWAQQNAANGYAIRQYGNTGGFTNRSMSRWASSWIVSTDASRTARNQFYVDDYTQAEEYLRADATGSGVNVYVGGDFAPLVDGAYSLGSSTLHYKRLYLDYTNTATVGNVTINKASGTVNIAALGSGLTVTNSLVTANAHVMLTLSSDPGVALSIWSVASAGSFTITTRPAVVNQTAVDFVVISAD